MRKEEEASELGQVDCLAWLAIAVGTMMGWLGWRVYATEHATVHLGPNFTELIYLYASCLGLLALGMMLTGTGLLFRRRWAIWMWNSQSVVVFLVTASMAHLSLFSAATVVALAVSGVAAYGAWLFKQSYVREAFH